MGKILQKKKNRSGISKARAKNNRLKSGSKKINVLGNQIIADNWDRKQTLTQNYQRLGLLHKLNAPTGGKERLPIQGENPENSLQITGSGNTAQQLELSETRVERDPETGKILRVISDEEQIEVAGRKRNAANPLNDPLNDLSDNEAELSPAQASVIVQQLERQADREGQAAKNKKPRYLSQREVEWITRLVEKHGDNLAAMVRDRKLNPMQQTEGDLRRRINQLKESQQ